MLARRMLLISVAVAGFISMAGQIIALREFMIVFYGNELSLGFILGCWLVWVALGSLFSAKITDRIKARTGLFASCQLLLSLFALLTVPAIRSSRAILGYMSGEMVSFLHIFLSAFLILAPFCFVMGFMFSLACAVYRGYENSPVSSSQISTVYIVESLGALGAGVFLSLALLFSNLSSLQIMAYLAALNLLSASVFLLCNNTGRIKKKPLLYFFLPSLILFLSLGLVFGSWKGLENISLKTQWSGFNLLASRNSVYGNITLAKTEGQLSFFNNGLHLYTVPDKLHFEPLAHFALLTHLEPKEVLIVGGGIGGLAEECLKEPIKKLDYIELDGLLIRLGRQFLERRYYLPLEDNRVSIRYMDARRFIKKTKDKYDCIIVSLGDPYTAQLNRYYTVEFFGEVKKLLKEGGVFSFYLTGAENYLSKEQRDYLGSIYFSLKGAFRDVKVIPGDTLYFLACDKQGVLTYDYKQLMQRAKERRLELRYMREYYLFADLSAERIRYIEDSLAASRGVRLNYDFTPVSYYYGLIFWGTYFNDALLKDFFTFIRRPVLWLAAPLLFMALFVFMAIRAKKENLFKTALLLAVALCGFNGITLQLVNLVSFQIIYGYVFYKLTVIITCFMLGLTFGAWLAIRKLKDIANDKKSFIIIQCGFLVYFLCLPVLLVKLAHFSTNPMIFLGENLIFPLLSVLAGFLGGLQFSLANRIYLGSEDEVGKTAGLTYGFDLAGSFLATILVATAMVPLFGILNTCNIVALLNLICVVALLTFSLT